MSLYKIGLTGGIASGKSTVVEWLKERQVTIIDGDLVAREVVAPEHPCLRALTETFGSTILQQDGTLNRAVLGEMVFGKPEQLQKLNEVMHHHIYASIQAKTKIYAAQGIKAIVYDIPLLYETGWHAQMDEVWVVYVTPEIQLERLMARNHYNAEEARVRVESQMPLDEKRDRADIVIDNRSTPEVLQGRLEALWKAKQYLFQ